MRFLLVCFSLFWSAVVLSDEWDFNLGESCASLLAAGTSQTLPHAKWPSSQLTGRSLKIQEALEMIENIFYSKTSLYKYEVTRVRFTYGTDSFRKNLALAFRHIMGTAFLQDHPDALVINQNLIALTKEETHDTLRKAHEKLADNRNLFLITNVKDPLTTKKDKLARFLIETVSRTLGSQIVITDFDLAIFSTFCFHFAKNDLFLTDTVKSVLTQVTQAGFVVLHVEKNMYDLGIGITAIKQDPH
ncbi:MAG: hypothetical protein HY072_00915, partial [Deltaproteobacteria bacterium]|nr:hypothetical protein [Deltaproteobacteria bacterium]